MGTGTTILRILLLHRAFLDLRGLAGLLALVLTLA
jgi:hypothetical protein